jgi:hypothetical protein
MKANLLLLLAVIATANASLYTEHAKLNCFKGHGGINIDNSSTAPTGLDVAHCEARCDADPNCYCVVLGKEAGQANGKCYKRSFCNPKQCTASAGFNVFIKPGGPSPPPTPNPPPHPKPTPAPRPPSTTRNVLYIVFDDLRPDLSAYDVPFMSTPNIQKLADTGLTFTRAYCQEAVCSPSRNSFTTGRRPNSTKVTCF